MGQHGGLFSAFRQPHRFRDRREAGRLLAPLLREYAGREGVVVLALPRGGVPVAYEIACALRAPLDVFTVRKLGVPGHEELAMGAIATGGARVLDRELIALLRIPSEVVEEIAAIEQRELERRERLYRDDRPFPELSGKAVILVDDGLATGASMRAAIDALRPLGPARIVAAIPVAPVESFAAVRAAADDAVCYEIPTRFGGVGAWYVDFGQTTDDEVRALLAEASARRL